MKKQLQQGIWLGGLAMLLSGTANAEVTCTAAPDCASLGYNKTAAQCPSGGVKCPFNSSLMFCLKNTTSYNFQLVVPTAKYNVVYHDGTNAASYSYNANKTPIGLVYYIQPVSGNKRGLLMSLEQPIVGTYAEALEYCKNYVVKGTNVGDWRLPDVSEMLQMGTFYSLGTTYNVANDIATKMYTIRRGNRLSYSYSYSQGVSGSLDYYTMNTTTALTLHGYWSSNDYYNSPAGNSYYVDVSSYNYVTGAAKDAKYHFRCIMEF